MSTTLFCYQPGDVIYVQVDTKTPIRSYFVENNGGLREVTYDQLGLPLTASQLRTGVAGVAAPDQTRTFKPGRA